MLREQLDIKKAELTELQEQMKPSPVRARYEADVSRLRKEINASSAARFSRRLVLAVRAMSWASGRRQRMWLRRSSGSLMRRKAENFLSHSTHARKSTDLQ